MKSLRNFWWVH